MPVKVEQINESLFSDTVQSKKKTKSGSDEISQGQYRLCYSGVQVQSPGRWSGGQSPPESGEDFAQMLNWFPELNN